MSDKNNHNDRGYLNVASYLEDLITLQREKVATYARTLMPNITSEDLLNPDNFPQLINDPGFMYEDGILAGLLSAQISIRSRG